MENMCDCLVFRLESYTGSLPSAAASFFPCRLASMSLVLCLWLCECSAVLGTPSHQCAYVCLMHTYKSHIQNKEKNITLFQPLFVVLGFANTKNALQQSGAIVFSTFF